MMQSFPRFHYIDHFHPALSTRFLREGVAWLSSFDCTHFHDNDVHPAVEKRCLKDRTNKHAHHWQAKRVFSYHVVSRVSAYIVGGYDSNVSLLSPLSFSSHITVQEIRKYDSSSETIDTATSIPSRNIVSISFLSSSFKDKLYARLWNDANRRYYSNYIVIRFIIGNKCILHFVYLCNIFLYFFIHKLLLLLKNLRQYDTIARCHKPIYNYIHFFP